jgi:pimeloyl-ACP methyl ester carboxylesterase
VAASTGLFLALLMAVFASGCASTPAEALDRRAAQLGLQAGTLAGGEMLLRTYAKAAAPSAPTHPHSGELHIYLDGDGRPFVRPRQVARDPTPRDPLVLKLLLADPARAIYLGRPCYHGMNQPCDARLWTTARYGERVVASMTTAVARIIETQPASRVVLIGYSGGGVLAALIAERLNSVDALVTIAANLDIDAWTQHHGFSPLAESHNPARMSGQRLSLRHLHWVGASDDNVPPASQAVMRARVPWAEFRELADFDHRCCWLETWPARLGEITVLLSQSGYAPAPVPPDYRESRQSTSPAPGSP